ncbi:MAG: ABC transporter ATP-binding protein [Candidatus Rokuibacteriota bacterium]|nr:MAG: ABC transporter ATP-binding protein [Candidatus Rokubacteria bacterium]
MLEGTGISQRFGGLAALTDVSFRVGAGEIVGLIGPNGAGKTTLFNTISGLIAPSAGAVHLEGRAITGLPAHRIARLGLGRTFQSPRLFPYLTVQQHVVLSARFRPRAEASLRTRDGDVAEAVRALELVRLEHRAEFEALREPTGRRKLVELAMVLAARPRVLLLDELMAGLNPGEVQFAMRLVRRIRDERGAAIFWVEHVMEAIMGVADRVVVLHHGEKIAEGPPAAIAEDPRVLDAYLGERVA